MPHISPSVSRFDHLEARPAPVQVVPMSIHPGRTPVLATKIDVPRAQCRRSGRQRPSPPAQHDGANRDPAAPQLLLSQEELASLIGASRSTVTRARVGRRSRHIIGTGQRRIQILDRARRRRIANRDSGGPSLARGKPVALSNTSHERGPLSRREFEYGPRRIA